MIDKLSRFDVVSLAVAALTGGLAVLLLGFGVLLELPFEGPVDGSGEGAPLRPLVLPLMGPLACGVSARAGQRSRQTSSASPSASVIPRCCSRPSRSTTAAALSLLRVFSGSGAGGERNAPNTFNRRKTLS